jgi:hypothetical protein
MKSPRSVSTEIHGVEGFDVRFLSRDGTDIAHRRVEDYQE